MRFVLGRTALILIDDVRGRPTVDADLQTLLATLQERSDNSSAVVAKLLLARLVVDRAPEQIAPVRSTLEKFGDKPILSPHGGGNYGPTTRYVAQLSVDPDEKAELLDQSIIAADQQGPLVWRVHTRLDRGQLGCAQSMTEAAELATGTALAPVVESRIAGLG